MKKLFLTSTFAHVSNELKRLIPGPYESLKVAFIPTAADVYDDAWYVKNDRAKLEEMGFEVIDISLKEYGSATLNDALRGFDCIFVAGGNTFYLLEQARRSGFVDIVPELIENGVIYVGSSAGSYIACPTIEVAEWKHQDRNIVNLTDLHALSLVPFLLSAHYKPEYGESLKEGMRKTSLPVKILTDTQALIVQGNEVKLVGAGDEIKLI